MNTLRTARTYLLSLTIVACLAGPAQAATPTQVEQLNQSLQQLDRERAKLREQLRAAEEARRAALRESMASKHIATLAVDLQAEDYAKALHFGRFDRPRLGILLQADEVKGARISAVTLGSPAEEVKLKSGDRLLSINGKPLTGDANQRLERAQQLLQVDEGSKSVQLEVESDGKTRRVTATARPLGPMLNALPFGDAAANAELRALSLPRTVDIARFAPSLVCGEDQGDCWFGLYSSHWRGLRLTELNPELGRYFGHDSGVLVLAAGTSMAGVEAGDVWLAIDGKPVKDSTQAMLALRPKPGAEPFQIEFLRQRKTMKLELPPSSTWQLPIEAAGSMPKLEGRLFDQHRADMEAGLLQRLLEDEQRQSEADAEAEQPSR